MTSARRRTRTTVLTGLTAAALATSVAALSPASAAPASTPVVDPTAHVNWANGKPLTGKSADAPGQVVKTYLKSTGVTAATTDGLRETASWSARGGLRQVRLEQYVAGLRVHASYAKAAVDASGRLVSLVEDTVKASTPVAATVTDDDAFRAAVAHLYPGRSVSATGRTRSGATSTYARQGFASAPTVEKVAVPTSNGGVAEAYEVTTWDTRTNALDVTLVSGDGKVVDTELRTASDSYNIFPEDPDKTPQTVVSPNLGWLTGSQRTQNISGNNAHAYLDTDNDDAPDPGGQPAGTSFLSVFDPTIQPSAGANPNVAVQNLFYLNNLIHDTLYAAGFTEAAGNFQNDNLGRGGKAGDAVNAEAQDGGGTDNANFATPHDGKAPRMQMYLWNAPITHEVVVSTPAGIAGTYDATGAEWGPALSATGLSGPVVRATPADACTALSGVPAGAIVLADRGTCAFTDKAKSAQSAGASAIIIANNVPGQPFTMGGTDATVTIPGVMVSQATGATLASGTAAGESATVRAKSPKPIMADGDLDTDIVWHEYGHGLTWRMIGRMSGPMAGAIGEGMSDVLSEVVNDDPVVGEYAVGDPAGIRTHSYEGYNRSYGDIVGEEVHLDGEVYGAIGWSLWKRYKAAGLGRAAILADLVDGMNYTPASPAFEQMRDGILAGLATTHPERVCDVWRSFAEYGVGVGAKGKVAGKKVTVNPSTAVPASCA